MAKRNRPKFSHECDLGELADRIVEIVNEEGMDTDPRESLCYIADRIRALGETHVPNVLRDLRDMGWVILQHRDVIDTPGRLYEPVGSLWMMFKRTDEAAFRCAGLVFEGRGDTDESALWNVAAHIAKHELKTQRKLKYANKLLNAGKSFKQAIEAARKLRPLPLG